MPVSTFAAFGIAHGAAPAAPADTDAETFEDAALTALTALRDAVTDEILPRLPDIPGTWHPTGFMVFPLGHHPTLGSLRLHVWPRGIRRRELKGRGDLGTIHDGDIHDHAWGVASAVLADYCDTLYDVRPTAREDGSLAHDRFRVFTVAYGERAHNSLVTFGDCVTAVPSQHRYIRAGDVHLIAPGVFHAPTVPDDALAATLVFSGPRVLDHGPHVLIGGSTEPIVGHRLVIEGDDATLAQRQLTEAL